MICRVLPAVLALVFFSHSVNAQWKSYTGIGEIRDILVTDDVVWSGTSGGVLQVARNGGESDKITNTEGLSSNDVVAAAVDGNGAVWFGLSNGLLNRYVPDAGEWKVVRWYESQAITGIVSRGDSLYIGLEFGVSLYIIGRDEVKETYRNFGFSDSNQFEETSTNAIVLDGTDIWVATDKGVAKSSLLLSNLLAPDSWEQYTSVHGLPSGEISSLAIAGSEIYAGAAAGVFRFENGVWQRAGSLTNIIDMASADAGGPFPNPTLVATNGNGAYWLDNGTWQLLGLALDRITAIAVDEESNVWLGRRDAGVYRFDAGAKEWLAFEVNGPVSSNFEDVALDGKGRLWCAAPGGIVMLLDGETWTNFNVFNRDFRAVMVDALDRVWFGSWGGGIIIFEDDTLSSGFKTTVIDATDGVLTTSDDNDPAYPVVTDVVQDQDGNIWAANYSARNNRGIVAFRPDGISIQFSTDIGGRSFSRITSIDVDRAGRVWFGTAESGVRVLDYNGTIDDFADDQRDGSLETADGLFSNNIASVVEDAEGFVWVGTSEGVNFWSPLDESVHSRFDVINNVINVIGVDPVNNKWFGTGKGVSVLNIGDRMTHYTTDNSGLVNNDIQAFAFNAETGEVWIATTNGLSRFETPFIAPKEDFSQLSGYPNPFIIDGSENEFVIENLAEDKDVSGSFSNVRIFTSSGKLVRSYDASVDIQGALVTWDGKDEDGEFVPSGIYVYFAYIEDGISALGKVAVIRR
jgi:ligand-binding sensor domain-containing protein